MIKLRLWAYDKTRKKYMINKVRYDIHLHEMSLNIK